MDHQQEKNELIGIVCLARQSSTRLPSKVLADVCGQPLIDRIIASLSKLSVNIIFAIPDNQANEELYQHLINRQVRIFRGSEDNVLERFCAAAGQLTTKYVQRFNCDNLLIDLTYMSKMIDFVEKNQYFDLFSNTHCENHSGQSIEIVRRDSCSIRTPPSKYETEHVFPYFYRSINRRKMLPCPFGSKFAIDTIEDLVRARQQIND